MSNRILSTVFAVLISLPALAGKPASGNAPSIPLLRLKMVLDSMNYDDIAIGFLASATTAYNAQFDSAYLPGWDASEGLACFSSDNVPLSVNIVPLPGQAPLVIRLDVEAKNSGPFTLLRTRLDSIPQAYEIWLMDKYKKDSLDLRNSVSYAFNINKSDTASFGSNRFTVVIRQHTIAPARMLGFSALKTVAGNQLNWATEDEQNTSIFWVERSIDGGTTFIAMDSLKSNGSGAYSYTDKNPFDGMNFYRVKMNDTTGRISFSNVVSVSDSSARAADNNSVSVYPNPSSGMIHLAINVQPGANAGPGSRALQLNSFNAQNNTTAAIGSYTIRIVNIKGMIVRSAKSNSTTWQDNMDAAAPGTYIIEVVNGENKMVGESTFIKL